MTDTAGVIAPPPLLFLGGLAVGIGLELLLGSSVPDGVQWIGGALLVVAGVALLLAFERAFSRRGTAVEPWKPSTAIVTDGPYRFADVSLTPPAPYFSGGSTWRSTSGSTANSPLNGRS